MRAQEIGEAGTSHPGFSRRSKQRERYNILKKSVIIKPIKRNHLGTRQNAYLWLLLMCVLWALSATATSSENNPLNSEQSNVSVDKLETVTLVTEHHYDAGSGLPIQDSANVRGVNSRQGYNIQAESSGAGQNLSVVGPVNLLTYSSDSTVTAGKAESMLLAEPAAAGSLAPGLSLLSPLDGSTITGRVPLSADASDAAGIATVSFSVDGIEVANMAVPPYAAEWDSNSFSSGSHSLEVTATNTLNEQTTIVSTIFIDSLSEQPSAYPASTIITGLQWAPANTIVRGAQGSDNWPVTWADDGDLYAAYGDGWGFSTDTTFSTKLSLGYARVSGPPTAFVGVNIPSPTGEQPRGDGRNGKKPSGLLMVDSILYQWVRNANNSGKECELAWSADHASVWTWSSWRFAEFGYCAFLNFGANYAGARDGYVYMYSPDSPDAYVETDNLILTRVPEDQITDRGAYEFYAGLDGANNPIWTADIESRQPILTFAGAVNRVSATYHPVLGRYLITLRSRAFNGGLNQFSIFEADEPWGSWSAVYYTENWEGNPTSALQAEWGDAQNIPAKWLSPDGKELFLVFAGDDSFAVRQATLTVSTDSVVPT